MQCWNKYSRVQRTKQVATTTPNLDLTGVSLPVTFVVTGSWLPLMVALLNGIYRVFMDAPIEQGIQVLSSCFG